MIPTSDSRLETAVQAMGNKLLCGPTMKQTN